MPLWVILRYDAYKTGGQSALLQNVKESLLKSFPRTTIKGDGQAVVVDYNSRKFEIIPAFISQGRIFIADTTDGGCWKSTNPLAEAEQLRMENLATRGLVKQLIKYTKIWKYSQDVDIRSIVLEYAALRFVQQWPFLHSSLKAPDNIDAFYHDWLVRDFFDFLLKHDRLIMENNEVIPFGNLWRRKTEKAYLNAFLACRCERADQLILAEMHWKNIFGSQFPSLYKAPEKQSNSSILSTKISY